MNIHTETVLMHGPAGVLELAIDRPATPRSAGGVAVVSHPHPLFGGTLHNKVVQTLTRACVQAGWTVVRHNFRGVGQSQGVHDHGVGEATDLLAVIQAQAPTGPLVLAGFSFGAFVTCQALAQLQALPTPRTPDKILLVGTATSRFQVAPIAPELHDRTLVVHGEHDDTVPLASALDWARPQALPITVVPGVEHFFHGRLPLLKALALRHLAAAPL
ncbi:MAG: alpha/beta hydrolase [Macromonas sp.]